MQVYLRTVLNIDEDDGQIKSDITRAIQHVKNLLQDEFDSSVSELSVKEVLQIYYNISAEPNSLTFDELKKKLEYLAVDWDTTVNVWDFSSVVDGLNDIESSVSDVASAMNTLQSGTALTVEELAKLAMKYPDLLKVSDLFTDTSIANQQELLNSILGSYEAEYDALIDTKIAELTATNELIQNQIDLENEKKNKVIEIADLQANGKLDSEAEYQRLLNELHDLEGQNFVTYSDGVLNVNEEMLAKMLEQQGDEVDSSKPIWGALGNMIIEGHSDGLTGALKTFPQYLTKLKSWAGSSLKTLLGNIATNIGKALSGDSDFVGLTNGIQNLGQVSVGNVTIETKIEGDYTIDGKSVDDWAADYLAIDGVDNLLQLHGVNNGAYSVHSIRAIYHLVAMLQVVRHREVGIASQDIALDCKVLDLGHITYPIMEAASNDIVNKLQHRSERQCALHSHLSLVPLDDILILEMLFRNLVEQSDRYFLFTFCHDCISFPSYL